MDVRFGKKATAQVTLLQVARNYIDGEAIGKAVKASTTLDDNYVVFSGELHMMQSRFR